VAADGLRWGPRYTVPESETQSSHSVDDVALITNIVVSRGGRSAVSGCATLVMVLQAADIAIAGWWMFSGEAQVMPEPPPPPASMQTVMPHLLPTGRLRYSLRVTYAPGVLIITNADRQAWTHVTANVGAGDDFSPCPEPPTVQAHEQLRLVIADCRAPADVDAEATWTFGCDCRSGRYREWHRIGVCKLARIAETRWLVDQVWASSNQLVGWVHRLAALRGVAS